MGIQSDLDLSATASVTLTADNQAVATLSSSVIYLSSDDTTAANRTFTLTAGTSGQILVVVFVSGTSTTAQLADSGNAKLTAAWEPLQYDSITLVCDGTNWIELARADN